ncbi:hypothetical protein [Deinococcus wulumuqiensis]|uniref:hypothetical protein n=1 Tax=Deinococcus wulumuqiensis TaxID=980427 RepID=UPI00242B4CC1|nr:hypothetical protein [Deinococcus wulumuqiensis]
MTQTESQTRPELQTPSQPTTLTALALLFAATLTIMAGATIAPSLPAMREHFSALPQRDVLVRLVLTLPALVIALTWPLRRAERPLGPQAAAAGGAGGVWGH